MTMEKSERDCIEVVCGSCIWSRPCVCCCCPPTRESHSARAVYTLFFTIILVLACLSHEMQIHNTVQEKIGLPEYNSACIRFGAGSECKRVTGFLGVYRLCALLFIFHSAMALITICVDDSQSMRANIHNGFWLYKFMGLAVVWCFLYLLPESDILIDIWKYVGIVCAFLFVLLQQISLIDCAYALNNYLRAQSVTNCCFAFLLYGLSMMIIAADVAGYTFLWYFYTSVMENYRLCLVNFIFLVVNGILAVGLCVASFFVVRKGMHMWLQGPFMVTYSLYLTWSAMANQPPREIPSDLLPTDHPRVRISENKTVYYCRPIGGHLDMLVGEHWSQHIMIYAGILIMLCFALYSSLRTAQEHEKFGIRKSRSNLIHGSRIRSLSQTDGQIRGSQRSLASFASHLSLHGSQYSLSNLHAASSPISPPSDVPPPMPGPPANAPPSSAASTPLAVDVGLQQRRSGNPPLLDKRLERLRRSEEAMGGRRRASSTSAVPSDVDGLLPRTQSGEDVRERRFEKHSRPGRLVRPKRLSTAFSMQRITSEPTLVPLPAPRVGCVIRDEFYGTRYNYAFFHLIFGLASLFVMAQLTNWVDPEGSHLGQVGTTWMTVWFKIGSCWSAFALFGWSLMCSRLGCGRDLVDIHRETLTRNQERRSSRERLRKSRSRGFSSQALRSPDREAVLSSPEVELGGDAVREEEEEEEEETELV